MSSNLQIEGAKRSGSEQAGTSDCGQLVLAIRELMRKEMEVVVVQTVERIVKPILEDLIRKVVKEELVSVKEKFTTSDRTSTESRSLWLKFLDEVSSPVLTGKEIKSKEGLAMRLAIVDSSGEVVNSGPAASARAEILVLLANCDEDEANLTPGDFDSRIIKENDKKKPHFAKSYYVDIKEGVGIVNNLKFGHGSGWMKSCMCRLGARVVNNLNWSIVNEAWTEPFLVQDSRSKFCARLLVWMSVYEKHYPPSLGDEVWRLDYIGKGGEPCKRLHKERILTVKDFLFLHSVDPERLVNLINSGAKIWKATVDHAETCIIDDKKVYLYGFPSEFEFYVAFDAVGRLSGIIRESHYVPLDNLSDSEKATARKLMLHTFENRKDITSMVDERSLLDQFPCKSNGICAGTNSTIVETSQSGGDPTILECPDDHTISEPGTSSQVIHPLGQSEQHLCEQYQKVHGDGPSFSINVHGYEPGSSDPYIDLHSLFDYFGDIEDGMSLIFSDNNNLLKTAEAESCSYQTKRAGGIRLAAAAAAALWMSRIRKRVMGSRDDRIQKRHRSR